MPAHSSSSTHCGWPRTVSTDLAAQPLRRQPPRRERRGDYAASDPFDGAFGRTFAFADLDGYVITAHDEAQMPITLYPSGPFSLTASASFIEGFPGTQADRSPEALRYAWAVDGDRLRRAREERQCRRSAPRTVPRPTSGPVLHPV